MVVCVQINVTVWSGVNIYRLFEETATSIKFLLYFSKFLPEYATYDDGTFNLNYESRLPGL
jgi:hypothetical protein